MPCAEVCCLILSDRGGIRETPYLSLGMWPCSIMASFPMPFDVSWGHGGRWQALAGAVGMGVLGRGMPESRSPLGVGPIGVVMPRSM